MYELRNGLVYRNIKDKLRFYVPDNMENHILMTYHDNMGHGGLDKTFELILRTYWFPSMSRKIKNIGNYLKCIEFNPKSGKVESNLHNIPKGLLPFECIHIDHYGPLDKTRNGHRYIFEIVDGFSKFIRFYPCKTTNTQEVIRHLESYFRDYSKPVKKLKNNSF